MSMIDNISFRKKLVILISIVSVTLLVVAINAVIRVAQIDDILSEHMTVQLPKADALIQADRDLHRALVAERSIMFVDVASNEYTDLVNLHKNSIANVRERILSEKDEKQHNELHTLFDRWQTTTNEVVRQRSADTRDGRRIAIDLSITRGADEFAKLREATASLANMAMERVRLTAATSGNIVASARNVALTFSAVGFLICIYRPYSMGAKVRR
jgi:methyl-accepting chemotaxis protein